MEILVRFRLTGVAISFWGWRFRLHPSLSRVVSPTVRQDPHVRHPGRRQEEANAREIVTENKAASPGEKILIIVASGSTDYREYRGIRI
jgi:hypothetical protein